MRDLEREKWAGAAFKVLPLSFRIPPHHCHVSRGAGSSVPAKISECNFDAACGMLQQVTLQG